MLARVVFGTVRLVTMLVVATLLASQAHAADDLATVFDAGYDGIELRLVNTDELLARRPRADDLAVTSLPGFPLTAEELSLVLRMTDPVGTGALADEERTAYVPLHERLVDWLTRNTENSKDGGVLSALIRDADEPGVRVDFDTDTEEVRLEYRVGF